MDLRPFVDGRAGNAEMECQAFNCRQAIFLLTEFEIPLNLAGYLSALYGEGRPAAIAFSVPCVRSREGRQWHNKANG